MDKKVTIQNIQSEKKQIFFKCAFCMKYTNYSKAHQCDECKKITCIDCSHFNISMIKNKFNH